VAPPSTQQSHPGRLLALLVIVLIVMLGTVLGANFLSPGKWHQSFKVGLGLDLHGGTTVTLKAVPSKKGAVPTKAQMTEASTIMLNRVNGAGFTGAQVQQQGTQYIVVSVPGQGAQKVANLVGATAELDFRQVLLEAPGYPVATTTPSPSATPTPSPSGSASPSASSSSSASASPSPSSSSKGKSGSNGNGQAVQARSLADAAGSAGERAKTKPSHSASPSPSPSPSASTTPSVKTVLPTTADAEGNASLVTPAVAKLFDKLNCHKNWQSLIYQNNAAAWDDKNKQIVSCDSSGTKYVLDVAKVTGPMLTSASGALNNTGGGWVVNFNLNGQGTTAFGKLTSTMFSQYYSQASSNVNDRVLDEFAIVLDGKVVSAPEVVAAITNGSSQITGNFTQQQVDNLATILSYGRLPLTFKKLYIQSVSAQLGSEQLDAGLIAAAIGLLLVVVYSFLYYRGLGVVSVSSLAIAATLSYLAVILLSKYSGFTLSLAGVAGLIVAIGITADSFVVYFERLRDEVREGKSLRAAVERGWQRARRTILVSDTVSFLAAALLYIFAIGDVRGFAFTLGLTTLIDVLVVFLFTKPMITLLARTKFYGQGHRLSGLDPARLGARSPWRGSRRTPARPAPGSAATTAGQARTTPKEA
jgi:preprotein translocase subunit SecD